MHYFKYIFWHISGIYQVYDVPATYPNRQGIYLVYTRCIPCLLGYVTGPEISHKRFSRYIPVIYDRWSYVGYILGIYKVSTFELEYAIYILGIFHVHSFELEYTRYIPGIFLYIVIYQYFQIRLGICQVYTIYILFELSYSWYMPGIYFLSVYTKCIPSIYLYYINLGIY